MEKMKRPTVEFVSALNCPPQSSGRKNRETGLAKEYKGIEHDYNGRFQPDAMTFL